MTTKAKHNPLTKQNRGYWGRQEISLLGTDCTTIQKLAYQITQKLTSRYKLLFCDASHDKEEEETSLPFSNGFARYQVQRKKNQQQVTWNTSVNSSYKLHSFTADIDLALVNGNHFTAANQILIIDQPSVVDKRKNQLTNIIALVSKDKGTLPTYVSDLLSKKNFNGAKFQLAEVDQLSQFIDNFLKKNVPPLYGLILGGGRSIRMAMDKIFLNYHGVPQHLHLTRILQQECQKVYISCRSSQRESFENPLIDTFLQLGPLGGILSAFRYEPNVAWLTIACDLVLLNQEVIEKLVAKRDSSRMATCFFNSKRESPEPLLTIWEPKAYNFLLQHLASGQACPLKALMQGDIKMLDLNDESVLHNVNTREEYRALMKKKLKPCEYSR